MFLYFSEKPISPSEMDSEGYAKVQALKEKYRDRGIYYNYSTTGEFESLFYAHLTQYFLSVKAIADAQLERNSQLVLRGIGADGILAENPTAFDFKLNSSKDSQALLVEIKELYRKIDSMHMGQRLPVEKSKGDTSLFSSFASIEDSFFPPVTIDENIKETITSVAESLEIPLSHDFFHLGNLSKNITLVSVFGECSYTGTPAEKLKHKLIIELHESIFVFINWSKIKDAYAGLTCIQLAIENNGTAVDKDVEVEFRFDAGILLPLDKFPIIEDENSIEYLLDKCDLEDLLSISSTSQYKVYGDSQKFELRAGTSLDAHSWSTFAGRNYLEEYQDSLSDIYCYEIFPEKDWCIMKIKFDYIKHHTAIAFPTPIFLQQIPTKIEYTITSQNSPDVLSGKLLVMTIDKGDS